MKKVVLAALALAVIAVAAWRLYDKSAVRPLPKPEEPPRFWEDASFRDALSRFGKSGAASVTVVAPGSGFSEKGAEKIHAIADFLGVRFPAEALKFGLIPYNANQDEVRLELLKQALNDPDAEVIWAVRGGYGSLRLLSALAEMPPPESPKIFIGYSDMTFLHLLLQRWNWRTVHGAMFGELPAAGAGKSEENFRRLASLVSGRDSELVYDGLKPFNKMAEESRDPLEGVLCGGNLTCLAAAAGTPWALDAKGKILFLEDVKEQGYKIDRMLNQLRLSGGLDGVRAIILGEFTEGDDATEFALKRFAEDFPAPVFRSDDFGHGEKNYPLVFNAPSLIGKSPSDPATHFLRIPAAFESLTRKNP